MTAVILENPKYPHNVGGAIRAAACFGAEKVLWSGRRVHEALDDRLPREERMRDYNNKVEWFPTEMPFSCVSGTPVAVELHPTAIPLPIFEHPENAIYVFGPEDGGLSKAFRVLCHQFVVIPSHHCLNLAAAINIVLYDRRHKRALSGLEPMAMEDVLLEDRG